VGGTTVRATLHTPSTEAPSQKLSCSMLRNVSVPSAAELPVPFTWTVLSASTVTT